ncbi:helix-turn-helix transcriptional regulator [Martelella radicis]|uniref:Putative DNA-binding transcriptional regulator AlpA n=1 Tax=Martelella radicis TaxID=1397476 RepID=A0A7W6P8C7_9HYPH|nr:hypothetical protein [Martelella radicis]MBB4120206.1 putative DNA-binding transcriptional regulator AlpA [Martelella radicis]
MTATASAQQRAIPAPCARMLSRAEAAAYCGVSPATFDKMMRDKLVPKPKRIYARTVWDIRALDCALDALPSEDDDSIPENNDWD